MFYLIVIIITNFFHNYINQKARVEVLLGLARADGLDHTMRRAEMAREVGSDLAAAWTGCADQRERQILFAPLPGAA